MVRLKMAPDMEFTMELDLEGIDSASRDHDVQLHKAEVFEAFLEKLKTGFAREDIRIDTFCFGLDREKEKVS